MTFGRRRSLTSGERKLWAEIARSVTPLSGRVLTDLAPEAGPSPPASPGVAEPSGAPAKPPKSEPPLPKPLAPVDRKIVRDLGRGVRSVDAKIDLHGLTQAEAHRVLMSFLARSQQQGHRVVLVVTGKGRPSDGFDPGERGVLRRMVPNWLSLPLARGMVMGWQEAGPGQGGAGALYVRLRRPERGA